MGMHIGTIINNVSSRLLCNTPGEYAMLKGMVQMCMVTRTM
ncbi:hypothetical protein FLA_4369 [Filimonas lacunae]|nr:hypothetical protein FLA_4369 [Filimonas lacunae]